MAKVKPLSYKSLSAHVYDILRMAILRRDFKPGERLDAKELARQFQVSETPVKEALSRLSEHGLVEIRPRYGTFVKPITVESLTHAVEARLIIEMHAVQQFSLEKSKSCIRKMRKYYEASLELMRDESLDLLEIRDRFAELDCQFHFALVESTRNSILTAWYTSLSTQYQTARALNEINRIQEGIEEHHAVLQALERMQLSKCEKVLREHIETSLNRAIKVIEAEGGAI